MTSSPRSVARARRASTIVLSAFVLLTSACGPTEAETGYTLVFVDTDAPLPSSMPEPEASPALFDTLEVALIDAHRRRIPGTLRRVELNAGAFSSGPISFAVLPTEGNREQVLELVLFRRAHLQSRFAPIVTDIAARVRLPHPGSHKEQRVFVSLLTEDVGGQRGFDAPLEPESYVPTHSRVGSWAKAARVPCVGDAGPDEVCVPGGAFWRGDPLLRDNTDLGDADREQLTVVPPCFFDRREVTVREFRAAWPALERAGLPSPPIFSGERVGANLDDYSTYVATPPGEQAAYSTDDFPVNGVVWSTARAYCQSLGKDLPSEAVWEHAASGLGEEREYPWGNDTPACNDAIFARAGYGEYADHDGTCRTPGSIGGAEVAGVGQRDVVTPNAGSESERVLDLAGNLSEWMLDDYVDQADAEPISGVQVDELKAGQANTKVVKGGSWRGRPVATRAASRYPLAAETLNRSVGFRCVRRAD